MMIFTDIIKLYLQKLSTDELTMFIHNQMVIDRVLTEELNRRKDKLTTSSSLIPRNKGFRCAICNLVGEKEVIESHVRAIHPAFYDDFEVYVRSNLTKK